MSNDRGASFFEVTFSFLIGTATGFILGVLFAPAAGTDTRKKIGDAAVKTGERAKEGYEKIAKEAARALGALERWSGLPGLFNVFTTDNRPSVQIEALKSIYAIGGPKVKGGIFRILRGSDVRAARRLARAMQQAGCGDMYQA